MAATAKKIADQFIGAAQKNPNDRPEIFRRAAYTFMGLAQDPKNIRSANSLAKIGLQFADASHASRPPTMDDFQDLLQETVTAYHETADPMDLVSRRREIHDERTPLEPGRMSIAPESFNRDATLGRSALIKFAPTQEDIVNGIQQAQNVAFWQGVKKEAQAMTVDISLGFLPVLQRGDAPATTNIRPYAEVEFGSDGNRNKVKFDVGFGKRITVPGNYIAVTVGMDHPRPGGTSTAITAGASIGAFAAPSLGPVILTEYVDALGVGMNSPLIPIPLKAVQLLPILTSYDIGETLVMRIYDYGGNFITQSFYQQGNDLSVSPLVIYGDAAFIEVHSNGTNAHVGNIRLPFQLAL